MDEITFQIVPFGGDIYKKILLLRYEILYKDLNISPSPEEIALEKDGVHVAGFIGNKLVATALLENEFPKCYMRKVAVSANIQGTGIGSKMVAFCEEYARKEKYSSIYCFARDSSVKFYLKNHYITEGEYIKEEEYFYYISMSKEL